ncbi:protein TIFY 4B-like isoform X1 [Populus nigra]|uniref:protein TIFY 4B-like isoform X1 n=2 Tax=Populus nigra TaxID=3691 RepID=UPI002B27487F|nr:protein TIFY 4B-like isoform X1 [Populus nigra]
MQPGETVSRSALEKPLHQLTEDDISQLTREDCRRYLKEKGMRRPSWNKSQAIQQVISLKTLLETTPETESPRRRLYIPPPDNPPRAPANSSVSVRGESADAPILVSAEELVPSRQPDPPNPVVPADPPPPVFVAATENDSVSPRTTGAAKESAGQMTIFYCGKVNVYDNVPRDKAQVIMHLAASPFPPPQEASSNVIPALWPIPCQLETPGVKATPNSTVVIFPNLPTVKGADDGQLPQEESSIAREDNLEGSTSRKASLQRYLEKKKDRLKNKRKVAMTSASVDIYLNHRVGDQISNDHWNLNDACSSPQPRPPQTPNRCNSIDNLAKNGSLSADLNEKGYAQKRLLQFSLWFFTESAEWKRCNTLLNVIENTC